MRPLPRGFQPYFAPSGISRTLFEERIASEPNEIAAAFSLSGKLVLAPRQGKPFEVHFAPEEADRLADAVVTHSHPQGGLLSGEDARFAADFDIAEMRAVLPDRLVYSIARPFLGWPNGEAMQQAAERCVGARLVENATRMKQGLPRMSRKEADAFMFEDQRNAFHELGVELRRTNAWQ